MLNSVLWPQPARPALSHSPSPSVRSLGAGRKAGIAGSFYGMPWTWAEKQEEVPLCKTCRAARMQQHRLIISLNGIQDTSHAPGSRGSDRQERALVRRQDAPESRLASLTLWSRNVEGCE